MRAAWLTPGAGVELVTGDIRDAAAVRQAAAGVDCVCHLAYINGTEYFYSEPELVLDVAIRGMLNVLDACRAQGVGDLVLASSSEVYEDPLVIPTDEHVPLSVPDVLNPRFSYGGARSPASYWPSTSAVSGSTALSSSVLTTPTGPIWAASTSFPSSCPDEECCRDNEGPVRFPIQGSGMRRVRLCLHYRSH